MNSDSSGSTARSSRARRSECRTRRSNSSSDSGCQSASFSASHTVGAPIRKAPATNSAAPSSNRIGNDSLKPWARAMKDRPKDNAMPAAQSTRRSGGVTTRRLERTCNHEALDLVRALVDLRDLGVAQEPLDRVLLHVAVAAEHLDGLHGHAHRRVRAEQLGHRGVLAHVAIAAVHLRAGLVEQLAAGRALRLHVGELELDRLEGRDRLAELAALLGVGGGVVGGSLSDAQALRGDAEARVVE